MKIPGVESGNDIIQAYRVTDIVIAMQTLNDNSFVDIEKMIYVRIASSNPIRVNGKTVGCIGLDGKLNIYKFSY